MATLVICWVMSGNICVFGTKEVMPSHFSCIIVKRLWIERWIADGIKEPDLITCRRVQNG
jgi:hypothetical protein